MDAWMDGQRDRQMDKTTQIRVREMGDTYLQTKWKDAKIGNCPEYEQKLDFL